MKLKEIIEFIDKNIPKNLALENDEIGFKKEYNFYTVSIIGLMVIKFLTLIPIISLFIGFFGLLFGLGMIICLFVKEKKLSN